MYLYQFACVVLSYMWELRLVLIYQGISTDRPPVYKKVYCVVVFVVVIDLNAIHRTT